MANEKRGDTVAVLCSCKGRNDKCLSCYGTGTRHRKACRRCGGVGNEGGAKCVDCRGLGYRDVDDL